MAGSPCAATGWRRPVDPEEFRRFGHQVVDWIADYRARAAQHPVMSRVEPGSVRAQLPSTPPETLARLVDLVHEATEHPPS